VTNGERLVDDLIEAAKDAAMCESSWAERAERTLLTRRDDLIAHIDELEKRKP